MHRKLSSYLWVAALGGSFGIGGRAEAGFINFDVDPNGNPITAPDTFNQTTPLTTLYASEGVTFSGPAAGEGGAILADDGGANYGVTAPSGSNFLAFNQTTYAVDPETISFASLQNMVSIDASGGNFNGNFTLNAYDAKGNLLGSSTVLGSAGNYSLLSFTATGNAISSVTLQQTNSADYAFVYDNLTFTSLVPEPSSLILCGIAGSMAPAVAIRRRLRNVRRAI